MWEFCHILHVMIYKELLPVCISSPTLFSKLEQWRAVCACSRRETFPFRFAWQNSECCFKMSAGTPRNDNKRSSLKKKRAGTWVSAGAGVFLLNLNVFPQQQSLSITFLKCSSAALKTSLANKQQCACRNSAFQHHRKSRHAVLLFTADPMAEDLLLPKRHMNTLPG